MSLIYCGSCSGILSQKDTKCPNCGALSPKKGAFSLKIILLSMAMITLIASIVIADLRPVQKLAGTPQLSEQQKSRQEQLLVSELKSIPATEIYTNMHMYKVLQDLYPSKQRYIKKHTHYAIKVKELEQKIGERPLVNDLDGIPSAIKSFINKRAKDKRSVDIKSCSTMNYSDIGWVTSCEYSGGSIVNAEIHKSHQFTLRHNNVVTSTKIF